MDIIRSSSRPFGLYAIGSIISNAVNLLLLPVISRHLNTAAYGIFSLSIMLFAFLNLVLDGGLVQGLVKFHGESREPDEKKSAFVTIALPAMLIATLLALLVLAVSRPCSQVLYGNRQLAPYIRITVVAAWSALLFQLVLTWLRTSLRPGWHLALISIRTTLFFLMTILLLKLQEDKLQALFISWTIPYLLLALVTLPYALVKNRSFPRFGQLKTYFRYCLPLVPAGVLMWVLGYTDLYLLRRLASLEEVGVYNAGVQISYIISPLTVAVQLGWLPFVFSVFRREQAPRLLARLFTYLILVALLAGMATSFFSTEITHLLTTFRYYRAGYVVPPLMLSGILYIVFLFFCTGINVQGRTLSLPFITLGAVAVNIILNIALIPRWGIYGAAYATAAANLFLVIVTGWRAHTLYPVPFINRHLLKAVIWCAVVYNVYLFIDIPQPAAKVLVKVGLLGSIPLFLYLTGFFKKAAFDEIKKTVPVFRKD